MGTFLFNLRGDSRIRRITREQYQAKIGTKCVAYQVLCHLVITGRGEKCCPLLARGDGRAVEVPVQCQFQDYRASCGMYHISICYCFSLRGLTNPAPTEGGGVGLLITSSTRLLSTLPFDSSCRSFTNHTRNTHMARFHHPYLLPLHRGTPRPQN